MLKSTFVISLTLAFGLGFLSHRLLAAESPSRVTGIGGVFLQSKDPAALKAWYGRHLGMPQNEHGTLFEWKTVDSKRGVTQWSVMKQGSKYFAPSSSTFMINYRVSGLTELVKQLRADGVQVLDEIEPTEYGSFVHVLDLDGNKVELWEPPAE